MFSVLCRQSQGDPDSSFPYGLLSGWISVMSKVDSCTQKRGTRLSAGVRRRQAETAPSRQSP